MQCQYQKHGLNLWMVHLYFHAWVSEAKSSYFESFSCLAFKTTCIKNLCVRVNVLVIYVNMEHYRCQWVVMQARLPFHSVRTKHNITDSHGLGRPPPHTHIEQGSNRMQRKRRRHITVQSGTLCCSTVRSAETDYTFYLKTPSSPQSQCWNLP